LSESRELKGIEDIGLFELNESILQKIAELYKGKEIDYKIT
jgi:hypothetical protein